MPEVVGIRFKQAGKLHYCDSAGISLKFGDLVIIKAAHGLEIGRVVTPPGQIPAAEIKEGLKQVLRKVHAGDMEQLKRSQIKEVEALKKAGRRSKNLIYP